jgi:oligoendopeptidase F
MKRKELFQTAIKESLESLRKEGKKITKTAVIENARFENGKPVGKTTLYSRNESTKEFVHADLLREIDDAAADQAKTKGKKTRSESFASLRKTIADLREENAKLVDQVVEQEARLQGATTDRHGDKHVIAAQEDELYVLTSIINRLTDDGLNELVEYSRRYSAKYRNDSRLKRSDAEVERFMVEIKHSRFLHLSSV